MRLYPTGFHRLYTQRMRQASKPPSEQISDLRLARLLLWARLWLGRWARLLPDFLFKPNFAAIERVIGAVIILRADARNGSPPPPAPRLRRPSNAPPGFKRARPKRTVFDLALGKIIRRTRRRDPIARIQALAALIDAADIHTARIAKRLKQGLGGASLIAIRPPAIGFSSDASAPEAAFADTS